MSDKQYFTLFIMNIKMFIHNTFQYIKNYITKCNIKLGTVFQHLILNQFKKMLLSFMVFYLRLMRLPMILIIRNLPSIILIILFNLITILFINNIFDQYAPNFLSLNMGPYLNVYNSILLITMFTSLYLKFNIFMRIINLFRSFFYIRKFWKSEQTKLLLTYILYSLIILCISLNFIIKIESQFLNENWYDLYVIMSMLITLILCFNHIEVIIQDFNTDKELNLNIGKIVNYSLTILIWIALGCIFIKFKFGIVYADADENSEIPRINRTPSPVTEETDQVLTTDPIIRGESPGPEPQHFDRRLRSNTNRPMFVEGSSRQTQTTTNTPMFVEGSSRQTQTTTDTPMFVEGSSQQTQTTTNTEEEEALWFVDKTTGKYDFLAFYNDIKTRSDHIVEQLTPQAVWQLIRSPKEIVPKDGQTVFGMILKEMEEYASTLVFVTNNDPNSLPPAPQPRNRPALRIIIPPYDFDPHNTPHSISPVDSISPGTPWGSNPNYPTPLPRHHSPTDSMVTYSPTNRSPD